MSKKKVVFDFYRVEKCGLPFDCLEQIFGKMEKKSREIKGYVREIYRLEKKLNGFWIGQFRKYRTNELPALAMIGEDEIELQLKENQGLIERNSFIYDPDRNILVWQNDIHANHPDRLAELISSLATVDFQLIPIATKNSIKHFMENKRSVLKFDLSIARPTSPAMYDDNSFASNVLSLMSSSNSDILQLKGGIDLRNNQSSCLDTCVIDFIGNLVQRGHAKKAKVLMNFDEGKEFIDLLLDRVKVERHISSHKKTIPFLSMVDMLECAYEEKKEVLDEIFGTPQNSLV